MEYIKHSLIVQVCFLAASTMLSISSVASLKLSSTRHFRSHLASWGVSAYSTRLSASNLGQFDLGSYVQSALLPKNSDKNVLANSPQGSIKCVDPVFVTLTSALETYSGDNQSYSYLRMECLYHILKPICCYVSDRVV